MLVGSTTGLPNKPGGMTFINHHHGVVLFGQGHDFIELRDVAIHRKHTIGNNQAESLRLSFLEPGLKLFHIVVRITVSYRFTQTHTIDDRRVVQRI